MDQAAFDRLARLLGGNATRRTGLRALVAAISGAPVQAVARDRKPGSGKHRRPEQEGPCGDGRRKDNVCTKDSQCCTGYCEKSKGKTNKDGKGRCRCIRAGEKCKKNQTCCGTTVCTNRICQPADPPGPTCAPEGKACESDAACCAGLICISGTCGVCAPDVCATGCAYTTIIAAYADAAPGDTIYIGPGEYINSIMIDKSITLVGCPGDPGAILIPDYAGGAVDSYFAVLYENSADTTLYTVTLRNLTVEGRNTADTYDFLLRSNTTASIDWTLEGCTLKNAVAGLYALSGNHVIEDSVITGCSYGAYVDTYRTDPMSLVVKNTTVTECDTYGVYFSAYPPAQVTVEGCTFRDNAGTGLYFYGQDPPAQTTISISTSTFTGNGAPGKFGGSPSFFLYHGTGTITGSTFSVNRESIYNYDAALTMTDTQITGNTGQYGGGLYLNANAYAVSLTLEGTTAITNNTATSNGGGIYSNADCCPLTVTGAGTRVSGNSPDQCYSDEAPGVVNCGTWLP